MYNIFYDDYFDCYIIFLSDDDGSIQHSKGRERNLFYKRVTFTEE